MSITTKTGDEGLTDWLASRVSKTDPRIEMVGGLDELDAYLGRLIFVLSSDTHHLSHLIKEDLVVTRSMIRIVYGYTQGVLESTGTLSDAVEQNIFNLNNAFGHEIGMISNTKLGVSDPGSLANIARTVARRVERCYLRALDVSREEVSYNYLDVMKFLNRLSDYLFTAVVVLDSIFDL